MDKSTLLVCEAFLSFSSEEDKHVNYRQLSAMLFTAQILSIEKGASFLIDEDFVAWKYGPAIISVYDRYALPAMQSDVPGGFISDSILHDEELETIRGSLRLMGLQPLDGSLRDDLRKIWAYFIEIDGNLLIQSLRNQKIWQMNAYNINKTIPKNDFIHYYKA